MNRFSSRITSLITTALLIGVVPTQAFAAPLDFDGDGLSDLTSYTTSGKKLVWKTRLSSTQEVRDLGTFGGADDLAAPGTWISGGSQVAVISLDKDTVVWSVQRDGNVESKTFGSKGDLVLAGGDYNGNGILDAAVVRLKDGKAVWQLWLDLFNDSNSQPTTVNFGVAGDRAFFAKVDSQQNDWIGVVRAGSGKRSQARMRNVVTGQVKTFNRLPAFASTGDRPRPFAVRQDSSPDLLAFHTTKGTKSSIRLYTLQGVEVDALGASGSAEAFIGDLTESPGYELAYVSSEGIDVYNPMVGEGTQVEGIGGTIVDSSAFRTMGGVSSTGSTGGGASGGGGVGPVAQCSRLVSWPSSYIYKTVGSDHFTDVRRNTIGLIMKIGAPTANATSCVQVLAANGKVITSLGLYARGSGWAARYYSGFGCGASTPVNGNAVASLARSAAGSSRIIMNIGGTCYGPIEATKCLNSSSC